MFQTDFMVHHRQQCIVHRVTNFYCANESWINWQANGDTLRTWFCVIGPRVSSIIGTFSCLSTSVLTTLINTDVIAISHKVTWHVFASAKLGVTAYRSVNSGKSKSWLIRFRIVIHLPSVLTNHSWLLHCHVDHSGTYTGFAHFEFINIHFSLPLQILQLSFVDRYFFNYSACIRARYDANAQKHTHCIFKKSDWTEKSRFFFTGEQCCPFGDISVPCAIFRSYLIIPMLTYAKRMWNHHLLMKSRYNRRSCFKLRTVFAPVHEFGYSPSYAALIQRYSIS